MTRSHANGLAVPMAVPIGTAAVSGLATWVAAIDYQIKYVPDFDQKLGMGRPRP